MEYVEKGPIMHLNETGESPDPPLHEQQARKYMIDIIEGLMYRSVCCLFLFVPKHSLS